MSNSFLPLLLQHSPTTMALGKKSFLIRDILENQSTATGYNQNILQWILQARNGNHDGGVQRNWLDRHPVESDGGETPRTPQASPSTSSIESLMLLSNNYANNIESSSGGGGGNDRLASSTLDKSMQHLPPDNKHGRSHPHHHHHHHQQQQQPHNHQLLPTSQLYQHLYYYALQQHLSTAFANQTNNNETTLIDKGPEGGEAGPGYAHLNNQAKKIQKIKFKKSIANRFDSHKRNKSHRFVGKPSKANVKSTAAVVVEERIDYNQLEQVDWNGKAEHGECNEVSDNEDDEMKCHCIDDLAESEVEQGEQDNNNNNKCAARSRCRKLRRNRTVFTELQLMGLERRFDSQKYLSTPDRADLARALGLSQLQVKTWYQNRRMKWKKQVMQNGCLCPTKPKGRPKKDSIPTYGIEYTNSLLCPIFVSLAPTTTSTTTITTTATASSVAAMDNNNNNGINNNTAVTPPPSKSPSSPSLPTSIEVQAF